MANAENIVSLTGRLTADPKITYTNGDKPMCIGAFTLAVDRHDKMKNSDFINVKALGKNGEFVEKFLKKGTKISIVGSIQSGSYNRQDGTKVYTTDVMAEAFAFCESRNVGTNNSNNAAPVTNDGFLNVPDGLEEELPFN